MVPHDVCVGSRRGRTIPGKINAFNVETRLLWNIIVIQPSVANGTECVAMPDMFATWCQDVEVEIIISKPRESKARVSLVYTDIRDAGKRAGSSRVAVVVSATFDFFLKAGIAIT
jgi:hypothetical protein